MTEGDAALRDCGVIYFGNDWQAENRTSSHHVAARLARHLPVLYVDSPGLRAPSASGRDFKRALRTRRTGGPKSCRRRDSWMAWPSHSRSQAHIAIREHW